MLDQPTDESREERIQMEIVVDAYTPEEQALGWYYYLESHLHLPFGVRRPGLHRRTADCSPGLETLDRSISLSI